MAYGRWGRDGNYTMVCAQQGQDTCSNGLWSGVELNWNTAMLSVMAALALTMSRMGMKCSKLAVQYINRRGIPFRMGVFAYTTPVVFHTFAKMSIKR